MNAPGFMKTSACYKRKEPENGAQLRESAGFHEDLSLLQKKKAFPHPGQDVEEGFF